MATRKFIDNVRVASPCTEDWNKMHGNDRVRTCDHCVKEVNNLSELTRKQAKQLVRSSDGNLCIRYFEHPVTKAPLFSAQFHQITRRTGIAAGVVGASISLATLTYAQGEPIRVEKQVPVDKSVVVEPLNRFDPLPTPTATPETNKEPIVVDLSSADEIRTIRVISGGIGFARDYRSALSRAVDNDDIEAVRELIANGEDVNAKDAGYDKITPIFIAVENGNVEMVRLLIEAGAKVNVRNSERETPLMQMDGDATAEMVNLLIGAGAKVNLLDNDGNTSLILAAENCPTEVLKALIDAGADINLGNKIGLTPLMNAAEKGDIESVRLILNSGALVNARDEDGDNAWEYADEKEIEDLLVTYGSETRFIEPEGNYDDNEKPNEQPNVVINF